MLQFPEDRRKLKKCKDSKKMEEMCSEVQEKGENRKERRDQICELEKIF